jgi:hypothetical protein
MDFKIVSDAIQLLANISQVGLLGIALVAAYYARKQILADHERSRKQKAVDLVFIWSERLSDSFAIRRFIEELGDDECSKIAAGQEFKLEERHRTRALALLRLKAPDISFEEKDGRLIVKEEHSLYLRYMTVKYLNILESIMTAWYKGTADHEIIADQFDFLVDDASMHFALSRFRKYVGGERSYPNIAKFVDFKRHKSEPHRPPLIDRRS